MGVTEARNHHEIKLELDATFSESMLASARLNPKYRIVLHWHTTWRAAHFVPGSGSDMIVVSTDMLFIALETD